MPRRAATVDFDPDPARLALGRAIRTLRAQHGLTQKALEDRCGLDQTIISRLERGRDVKLRLSRLVALLRAFGVNHVVFRTEREGPTVLAFMARFSDGEDDPDAD